MNFIDEGDGEIGNLFAAIIYPVQEYRIGIPKDKVKLIIRYKNVMAES